MQLHRLKLNSKFRGIPAGFELHFGDAEERSSMGLQPNCFVGVNGSGKSNVLEVIAEMVSILDVATDPPRSLKEFGNTGVRFRSPVRGLSFELDFWFDVDTEMTLVKARGLRDEPGVPVHRCGANIVHGADGWIEMTVSSREAPGLPYLWAIPVDRVRDYIPKRVIGYSSGGNELLSNPFIKREIAYLNAYKLKAAEDEGGAAAEVVGFEDRMFFMDYDSNKLVQICNYLFRSNRYTDDEALSGLESLNEQVNIGDLHSFSIRVRQRDHSGKSFNLPSTLQKELAKLVDCATCYMRSEDGRETKLDFFVDDALRVAFNNKFQSAYRLFQALYSLRLYNAELYKKRLRDKVLAANAGVNLSNLLPKPSGDELVFHVDNIAFKKKGVKDVVYYKQLSDGEHQLMHVMGTIILMDTPGALFLLDEPETHFNPEWRARFVSLLNSCIGMDLPDASDRQQELVMTTHSPFVVSDCEADRVFLFQRNENDPSNVVCKSAAEMGFNTFGAGVDMITAKLFNYSLSFGTNANALLEHFKWKLKAQGTDVRELIDQVYEHLGDSAERVFFVNEALDKLQSKKTKRAKAVSRKRVTKVKATVPKKNAKKRTSTNLKPKARSAKPSRPQRKRKRS